MLNINDLKAGITIEYKDEPYQVLSSHHVKLGRGGAIQQTKLKNLVTGNVIKQNFKGNDKFSKVELQSRQAQFLYREWDRFHFMDQENYDQFSLDKGKLDTKIDFLKEGSEVLVINFNDHPINIKLTPKIVLEVKKAPPNIRGNTTQGGTKQVILETDAKITVPLFIKAGDKIRINTETRKYVERV